MNETEIFFKTCNEKYSGFENLVFTLSKFQKVGTPDRFKMPPPKTPFFISFQNYSNANHENIKV